MAIQDVIQFAKTSNSPISAVKLTPFYDESKGRITKGDIYPHKDWFKKGRFEKKSITSDLNGAEPSAYVLKLKPSKYFVIDIDVKNGKSARDIMTDDAYNRLYEESKYVVETPSKGIHFYYKIPNDYIGAVKNAVNIDECRAFFKEEEQDNGSVDLIVDTIMTEGSSFTYNGEKYSYVNIKTGTSISDVEESAHWNVMVKYAYKTNDNLSLNKVIDDTVEPAEIEEHIMNIPNIKRDWDNWYRMAQLIFNVMGADALPLFEKWSTQLIDDSRACYNLWKGLSDTRTDKKLTVATLLYLSKQADEEAYKKIRIKYNKTIPKDVTINDRWACECFVKLLGKDVMKQDNVIWIYDNTLGIWETGKDKVLKKIHHYHKDLLFKQEGDKGKTSTYDYGGVTRNINNMLVHLEAMIPSTNTMYLANSKGYLLFADGMFNMMNGTFTKGFENCHNMFFIKRIKRNFPSSRDYLKEAEINKVLFENPFNNKEIPLCLKNILARALAGHTEDKRILMIIGPTNCGKGVLTTQLKYSFDENVIEFNGNVLKYNSKDGADEAKKMAWYAPWVGPRLALSNEITMDKRAIDGNTLKKIAGGGDEIPYRTNFKDEVRVIPTATPGIFVNDMGVISPMDEAFVDRAVVIPYTKSFKNIPQAECDEFQMEADNTLKDKMKTDEWANGFLWIILDSYKLEKTKLPESVMAEVREVLPLDEVNLKGLIEERYEKVTQDYKYEGNEYVTSRDVINFVREQGVNMSDTKVGKEMTKLGYVRKDVKIDRKTVKVWIGLKI
jgi:hypothetical protein